MFKPELLSPAGNLKNMRYAFAYGADAVYAGQPRYSLRVRNNDFDLNNLAIGIDEARAQGKKLYVVSNIAPHNAKVKTYLKDIEPVIEMQPDALIMSDPGLIDLVKSKWPEQAIHLSVQANAVNYATINFWAKQGIERVILSRELALNEIKEMRELCPDTELEVFVHGALCMAYSGRCLLSGYMNKRDPNQGTCTNACRWQYSAAEGKENDSGDIVHIQRPTDKVFLLTEKERPDEAMPAFEDEHGTYIMNSKDLRAVQHVEALTRMGVHSLKIEGRTKSFYYCARTAQVYRKAIDDAAAGKPFDPALMQTLESLAHRGYTEGFLKRHNHSEYQNYDYGYSISERQQLAGEVLGRDDKGFVEIAVKNKFLSGQNMELMTPQGNINFTLEHMENKQGVKVEDAKGAGHIVYLPLDESVEVERGILLRNLTEGDNTRKPTFGG